MELNKRFYHQVLFKNLIYKLAILNSSKNNLIQF